MQVSVGFSKSEPLFRLATSELLNGLCEYTRLLIKPAACFMILSDLPFANALAFLMASKPGPLRQIQVKQSLLLHIGSRCPDKQPSPVKKRAEALESGPLLCWRLH